ncbi:MAG: TonB family protein [Pseudomonadota bacterium]
MNASLAWSEPMRSAKPLLLALSLALVLHLGLLLIHFATPERSPPPPSLPVVQIDLQSMPRTPPPDKAEMLAEREQRASEPSRAAAPQTRTEARPTLAAPEETPPPVLIPAPAESEPPAPEPTPAPKAVEKKAAASANKAPAKPAAPARPPQPPTPPVASAPASSLTERGLQMARLKSDVLQQSLRDDVAARSAVLTANTRYGAEAAYLNAWVNKVETIGNQNYPDEARRKNLSGRLMLEVKLDAWGKVLAVHVRQSSGLKVLDEAAQDIVRMGEPYAKFPLEMREKYDQITILRTWAFGPSGIDTR